MNGEKGLTIRGKAVVFVATLLAIRIAGIDTLFSGLIFAVTALLLIGFAGWGCVLLLDRRFGPAVLRIPAGLAIACGAMGVLLPDVAGDAFPQSWEWPIGAGAKAVMMTGGRYAVAANSRRIQIYGPDGEYLMAWPIPAVNSAVSFVQLRYDADMRELQVCRAGHVVSYSLGGSRFAIRRLTPDSPPFREGPYFHPRDTTAWHHLPFVDRSQGALFVFCGVALAAFSWRLGKGNEPAKPDSPGQDRKDAGDPPEDRLDEIPA